MDIFEQMSPLFYHELAQAVTSVIEEEAAQLEELAGSFGAHASHLSKLGWPTAAASALDRSRECTIQWLALRADLAALLSRLGE